MCLLAICISSMEKCLFTSFIVFFAFFKINVGEAMTGSFFKKNYLFIYLFLAALGLHHCTWAFSSCNEWVLLFVAVCRLLMAVASLVVEHRL